MSDKAKIICIGIDAGDKDLITQWAKEGALPTFRALFDTAAWATTNNPPGFEASSVWSSFYTGGYPGRTGLYAGKTHFCPETYEDWVPYKRSELTVDPLWTVLSRGGKRVALIDPPYTWLEANVNGKQLVDWGTHSRAGSVGFRTWPPDLANEILAHFGGDEIGVSDAVRPRNAQEHNAFRRKLIDRIERKTAICHHFLKQEPWDFFVTVFGEGHSAGHLCWYLHDKTHPGHDASLAKTIGDPIKDVYTKIDWAVGKLLDEAVPETTVCVFLSHGMGPHHSGSEFLDDILFRLEGGKPSAVRALAKDVLRGVWTRLPHSIRKPLMALRDPAMRTLVEHDRSGRKYFEVRNNYKTGGIRINLKGREHSGRVEPGAEYEAVCKQLTEDLLSLTNPATGRSLVREIYRTAELYDGPRVGDLPDLLVDWNREAPIEAAHCPKFGTIRHPRPGGRQGDHKPDGMVFMRGASIRAGQVARTVPVVDLAPTLAALLGMKLDGIDGKPVPEFCPSQPAGAVA